MKPVVCKFGGSSLADGTNILKVCEILRSDPARKYAVVSAPGKRYSGDTKVTDLLYECYREAKEKGSCAGTFAKIRTRFQSIVDELGMSSFNIGAILDETEKQIDEKKSADFTASRGEYLNARVIAAKLGWTFVDAKDIIFFKKDGTFDEEKSYPSIAARLKECDEAVIPGFYGTDADGNIKTFSRGGSDISGSIVARAVNADLYENWTDVAGVLAADPRLIQNPAPVGQLRYEELQTLSRVGMQILHEDAVAPVRQAQIPLRICNAFEPEKPGTLVRPQVEPDGGQICFAGRRKLAMLRLSCPQEPDAEAKLATILTQAQLSPFSMQSVCGELTALVPMEPGSERLHRLREQAAQALRPQACTLRENLSVLAALCRSTAAVPELLRAVETSGAPVHLLQKCGACALLLVNDSQYEQSLRAAYAASRNLHD